MSFGSFMKRFGSIVLKVGEVAAPAALTVFGGPFGTLVGQQLSAVLAAQVRLPNGTGEDRKQTAMDMMTISAPSTIAMIEQLTGHKMQDEARFLTGVESINDGIVDVLKAFGVIPSSTTNAVGPAIHT